MKRTLLIAATCLLAICALGQHQQPYYSFLFKHYSVANGLSQNDVTAILQDQQGFMWFGTWDGLNKFDGYNFTTYKAHPGDNSQLSTNRINFIYEDQLGFIWFQTYDNRIHRLDPKTEQFFSINEYTEDANRSLKRIDWFVEIRPGEIWTKTRQGVIRIVSSDSQKDPQITTYSPKSEDNKIVSSTINFIHPDASGNVWLGTNQGLQQITPDGKISFYQPDPAKTDKNFCAACTTDKGMYFGTTEGNIWYVKNSDFKFELLPCGGLGRITDIECLDSRYLIVATAGNGFYVCDTKNGSAKQYSRANHPAIASNEFTSITLDSHGIAWMENKQRGIFRYRHSDQSLRHFEPKVDAVHSYSVQPNLLLFEDVDKTLWINPQGGGFGYYDRNTDELMPFFNEPNTADCRFSNVIHTAYSDRQGNLWISTYNKGIELVVQAFSPFQHHYVSTSKTLTSNEVRACMQAFDGNIFIATKDGFTRLYDTNFKELGVLDREGGFIQGNHAARFDNLVYCMHEDSRHRIWLGSKGGGIMLLEKQGVTGSIPQYRMRRFQHSAANPYSLSSDNVYSIKEDKQGNIYVGTYDGGLNIVRWKNDEIEFVNANNELTSYPIADGAKVRDLAVDDRGTIWVGTTNGLFQMDKTGEYAYRVYHHQRVSGQASSLSNNDVHCIHIDKAGDIWFGTFGGGLNKLVSRATPDKTAEFCAFTTQDGLFSDIVLCIVEDKWGNMWFTSENSVIRFDSQTHTFQSFNVFNEDDNAHDYFSEATGTLLDNGHVMFGSNNGHYIFSPDQMGSEQEEPTIRFTAFLLANQVAHPGTDGSPLEQSISYSDKIKLKYNQNQFSIEYAALDFKFDDKIQYAFRMDGVDKQWNYVRFQRRATYTSLPHGTYVFHVKSTNEKGVWLDNESTLTIVIKPAPWETGWAYLLYLLLAIGILFVVYWLTSRFSSLKNEVEIEQKVTEIKLRFFTNISHELRTPLSLIHGPVENILRNEKITPAVRDQLNVVQSNATRMMRLINELLDFRKIQDKKLRLRLQQTNLYKLACNTYRNFTKEAEEKHISFTIEDKSEGAVVWLDRDKTDMILYNLLSNAFKYTPSGRGIKVSVETRPGYVALVVADQGAGIPRDKRNILFERFVNNNELASPSKGGTGIGLNLVKELVDLHKGFIEVESELNHGTTISVLFQTGRDHFDSASVDFVVEDPKEDEVIQPAAASHITDLDHLQSTNDLPKMLVVEDNDEMRRFMVSIFRNEYNVIEAADGEQGVEMALEQSPQIIISDLMMPNKDGIELVKELKEDQRTSHVPIILLTAKTAIDDRLNALRYGADDYITKPFSPIYLQTRVRNILEQRARLQDSFRQNLLELKPGQDKKDVSPDEAFLAKLMDVMERNLDNNELTVDDLVSEMSLGRTVFFNKLKGLTGLSPVEFIREIRIKRAAQLLEAGKYNITEITYMVGMNDSRYFSKCFKAAYGMTPSEYKKSLQK